MNKLICNHLWWGAVVSSFTKSAWKLTNSFPWSVRMTESEMIRCPESWQLDFQPSLKWDYCHGLELQAMLDVYDAYGDKKIYDYAYAYADTMIQADGEYQNLQIKWV